MKVLPALLLLAAFVGINANVRLPDPSWAVQVKPDPKRRLFLENNIINLGDDPIDCKNKIFSCADCKHSRVCHPQDDSTIVHYTDIECPADRPYCDANSGTCVSTASLGCGDADSDFICLEKNYYFPDVDCHKFHYCDENYKPTLFQCIGEGSVYDANKQKCVTEQNACGRFECDGNTLKKMKHTNYPRYYAMCKNEQNSNGPLVVGVCPRYYQISPSSQVCEPDCKSHGNGNIPHATDCTKYFTCAETTLQDGTIYMQRTPKSCPTGNSFDIKLFMCVSDPNGDVCKDR